MLKTFSREQNSRALRIWQVVEYGAAAAGLLMLLYVGGAALMMNRASAVARQIQFQGGQADFPTSPALEHVGYTQRADAGSAPEVIGRIEIPRLNLTAPVTEGIGRIELIRGVGHVPGTAHSGGLGTMALAGHRDTFFRGLRAVKTGMVVLVAEAGGVYSYQVDSTAIVDPAQVEVLAIGAEPSLVLVTCYPFNFIGAAPKRFIVHARLMSLLPA